MSVKGVTRNARNLMRTSGGSLPPGPEHDETGSLVGSHHNVVGRPGSNAGPSPCFFVPVHHAHGGHPRSRAVGFQRSALTLDGGRHTRLRHYLLAHSGARPFLRSSSSAFSDFFKLSWPMPLRISGVLVNWISE